jgi:hypothetical protein
VCGRHAARDKSKLRQTGNQERKERFMVCRCLERVQSYALIPAVCRDLLGAVEDPRERLHLSF